MAGLFQRIRQRGGEPAPTAPADAAPAPAPEQPTVVQPPVGPHAPETASTGLWSAGAPAPLPPGTAPAVPAGAEPGDPIRATRPSFADRGRLRRRLRYLRRVRELGFRDLGGLVFDQHRFAAHRPELVAGKLEALAAVDRELRALERALGDRHEFIDLREPGIAACPRCSSLHGSDARFCPTCGLRLSGPRAFAEVAEGPHVVDPEAGLVEPPPPPPPEPEMAEPDPDAQPTVALPGAGSAVAARAAAAPPDERPTEVGPPTSAPAQVVDGGPDAPAGDPGATLPEDEQRDEAAPNGHGPSAPAAADDPSRREA